ncbi:MAG: hypothetical protein V4580_11215 [Bacteroidota bacterium]
MKQEELTKSRIQIKAYSKTELAVMYNISAKSLQSWLKTVEKELGPRIGRFYTPKQVKRIFEEFGAPENV